MSYNSNKDLPHSITDHLPDHAQSIYRKAFNNAWSEYSVAAKRYKGGTQEEVSHRVAWSAVKRKYYKENSHWVAKPKVKKANSPD